MTRRPDEEVSSSLGIGSRVIYQHPLAYLLGLIAMIYARVLLELLIVFFRIHENVHEINQRVGGTSSGPVAPPPPPTEPEPGAAPADAAEISASASAPPMETKREPAETMHASEPTPEVAAARSASPPEPGAVSRPVARFCENCGAERSPGKRFCLSCGEPLDSQ